MEQTLFSNFFTALNNNEYPNLNDESVWRPYFNRANSINEELVQLQGNY